MRKSEAASGRELGITLISLFFAFGAAMCALTMILLAFPTSSLTALWSLNPRARDAFGAMGIWAIVLMLAVGSACAFASVGLWRHRHWGLVIAIAVLSCNLVGDLLNAIVFGDRRALSGVPIATALLAYLIAVAKRRPRLILRP